MKKRFVAMTVGAWGLAVLLAAFLAVMHKSAPIDGGKPRDADSAQNLTAPPSTTAKCVIEQDGTTIECRWPKDVPQSKLSRLFSPENAPNIGLFVVGLGGVIAAMFTLRAINRQANIQEAGMQQWIDIEARGTEGVQPVLKPFEVRLKFEAVNNTAYLLTIHSIVTSLSFWSDLEEVFSIRETIRLPPNRESKSSAYPFYVPSTAMDKKTFDSGTIVTINGEVKFVDCFGKEQVQWFSGLYECGPDLFKHLPPMGIVPDKQEVKHTWADKTEGTKPS